MSETIRAVTTVTTVTTVKTVPGEQETERTTTANKVQIAGLWFSAHADCPERPLLLVQQLLVDELSARVACGLAVDMGMLGKLLPHIHALRTELLLLTGIRI